jgi:hypothetical protein
VKNRPSCIDPANACVPDMRYNYDRKKKLFIDLKEITMLSSDDNPSWAYATYSFRIDFPSFNP